VVEVEHAGAGVNTVVALLTTQELPYKIPMMMIEGVDFIKIVESIGEFL
jgi:hypothetical protein